MTNFLTVRTPLLFVTMLLLRRMKRRTRRQPAFQNAVVRPIIRAFVACRKDSKTYPYNNALLTPLNHQLA